MATNRLYLLDTSTGRHCLLSKAFSSQWDGIWSPDLVGSFLKSISDEAVYNETTHSCLKLVVEDQLAEEVELVHQKLLAEEELDPDDPWDIRSLNYLAESQA